MKTIGKIGGCLVVAMAALGASAELTGDSLMDVLVERLGKEGPSDDRGGVRLGHLGSWYGTWLLSTPRQGLMMLLK